MKTKQLPVLLVCTSLLSGCGIARNVFASMPVAPSISFQSISPTKTQNAYIQHELTQTAVFKSQAEADSFMSTLRAGAALPSLDFSKEQGVLVLFGAVPNGGYKGEIAAIEEKSDKLIVHPVLWESAPGMVVTSDMNFPYHYVAMPRSEKPVTFAPVAKKTQPGPWYAILSAR